MSVETFVDQTTPQVISLSDRRAANAAWAGAKAARLAEALRRGLPVMPGFVITVADQDGRSGYDVIRTIGVRSAWAQVSTNGTRPLVVRSSSTAEDGDTSSMAGLFTSVVNVLGWRDFGDAVERVLASARDPRLGEPKPMAVLVQPFVSARVGGVLFGADPVTGRTDRIVIAAADGGPQGLVGGTDAGRTYTVNRRGRPVAVDGSGTAALSRRQLGALVKLARRAHAVFGTPQDVEWAIDSTGRLYLLQSRPLTGLPAPVSNRAPILGPGPVAETFPEPLTTLEQDLWVPPLRDGLVHALTLTGAASAGRLRTSPVVTVVGGRVVGDLDLLDPSRSARRPLVRLVDPRPGMRKLRAAWRVGQLRSTLPDLAADVIAQVDRELSGIPPLVECADEQVLSLLEWTRKVLTVLHTHEVAAGVLMRQGGGDLTASSIALRVLARSSGQDFARLSKRHPVVLVLMPPAIRQHRALPDVTLPERVDGGTIPALGELPPREATRLRARWVQELGARAALEAGRRLTTAGVLSRAEDVQHLTLSDLILALRERRLPDSGRPPSDDDSPVLLPAEFQLNDDGRPVAVRLERRRRRDTSSPGRGTPAVGGRAVGVVHAGDGSPPLGSVLVVQSLDPALAVHLPRIAGLVAETGNPLSHLAILAREFGVPTVVGVTDARDRFAAGARVLVDGDSGQVLRLELATQGESA